MGIRQERMAVLAAVEAVYGTDPVPAAATQLKDVTIDDMVGDLVQLDQIRTGMGAHVKALHGRRVTMKGKTHLASSGAAGTAPAWDWLARCTAHAKAVTAATKVEYTPIDTAQESAAIYFNLEGNRTRILGARGNIVAWRWPVGQFPEIEFDLVGIFDANASVAFPAVDYSAWKVPPLVGKDTVTNFKIGGVDEVGQSLEIVAGVKAEYIERINRRDVEIDDRRASATAVIEEPAFSARIYQDAVGVPGLYKSLAMTHGIVAGSIIKADVTNWQLQTFNRQKLGPNAGIQLGGEIVTAAGVADYKITAQ